MIKLKNYNIKNLIYIQKPLILILFEKKFVTPLVAKTKDKLKV